MKNKIISKTFKIIEEELVEELGKNYETEVRDIFNLKVLDDKIIIRIKYGNNEIFSTVITKGDFIFLPEIVRDNIEDLKEKIRKLKKKRRATDEGSGRGIFVEVEGCFLIDEFSNPIVDEFGNHISCGIDG